MKRRKKISLGRLVFLIMDYTFLVILMISMIIPLLKVFVDSVDPGSYGIRLWPKTWSGAAYKMILSNVSLYLPFLVSIFTTIIGTAVGLILTTLGAYVIIQKDMPGRNLLSKYILITMIFNGGMLSLIHISEPTRPG